MPTYYVIKDRQLDRYSGTTLDEAVEALHPDSPTDVVSAFTCEADDVATARLFGHRNQKAVPAKDLTAALRKWFDKHLAKY